jgi:uncharacterized membrane protein YphA (DoxX/SURF4 family)
MKTLSFLGRILYAVPFAIFGIFHFMKASSMASQYIKGWPIAEGLVYITGLAFILAAISIIINIKSRLACLLLALLLLIFVLAIHLPRIMSGNQLSMMSLLKNTALISLLKDTALMGAALTYSTILKK